MGDHGSRAGDHQRLNAEAAVSAMRQQHDEFTDHVRVKLNEDRRAVDGPKVRNPCSQWIVITHGI